jgi:hypothetical protein
MLDMNFSIKLFRLSLPRPRGAFILLPESYLVDNIIKDKQLSYVPLNITMIKHNRAMQAYD